MPNAIPIGVGAMSEVPSKGRATTYYLADSSIQKILEKYTTMKI